MKENRSIRENMKWEHKGEKGAHQREREHHVLYFVLKSFPSPPPPLQKIIFLQILVPFLFCFLGVHVPPRLLPGGGTEPLLREQFWKFDP